MSEPTSRLLDSVVGPHRFVADRSWGKGRPTVVEVIDAHGLTLFVKRHHEPAQYEAELTAYQRWVPALVPQAPTLRAHDDRLRLLVLSAVPGSPGVDAWDDPVVHHRAGVLLRRFHESGAVSPGTDFAIHKLEEFERWAASAADLVDRRGLTATRNRLRELQTLGTLPRVPCHLDYSPRNWLISDDGLSVIDFEGAGPETWVNDLGRLYVGPWRARAGLREAFLDGYGRQIETHELAVLRACAALTAVRLVVWAHTQGDLLFEQSVRANLAWLLAEQ